MKKIGFIGMGNMASAIAGGIIKSGFIEGQNVYAFDIDQTKLSKMNDEYQIQCCSSESELVDKVDLVVMAVKPNIVDGVIAKIKNNMINKAVISIVAGYNNDKYNELLLPATRHLTIMPNTPALVLNGMTLFEKENSLTKEELEFARAMFSSIGEVVILPGYQMKAGGSISGCGPAFVYMFIEAMADGGVSLGLPRDVAYKLASQTLIGSGMMQKETGLHPGILKDQVCSPGGITIKGVETLEENGFRNAVFKAIKESN
ncbi:pyrroline-5-carboxylate reductase [Thomasclavelia saccharogumia]|uniref:pyrroline-5-carboxylate reductase n=1 Tax=Thomasclavelia saccharogumia TaxID=341225 RepID=UPI00047DF164|nr:pyrroline-5-carboxylate reductase [Thomasclavelia saccharogumia]